ncbi:alpha/beta fold hydrolase [Thalassolituus sp. LLYu03]|uniref:alpha/beta fold hydrolase n=1 Tax=Thalassolituus sp. LLYu03 TaxID=3421656 RepID=UPI003D2B86D1
MTVSKHSVQSGDVRLNVITRGDPANTPMVLVHGYPDNHSVWDEVGSRLAQTYYVIAYDVRGAGQSDIPPRIRDYRLPQLSEDLKAVVDALIPGRRFHLAAHDWGSIQSWESVTTERLQGRILSYSSVSGPCLDHMGFWMRDHLFSTSPGKVIKALRQLLSSWYIVFFQIPVLAPLLWRVAIAALWPTFLRLREGVKEPEANPTQANDGVYGVRLYRANFIGKMARPEQRYAHCPVQLIVPTGDNYVGTQLFSGLSQWVEHLYQRDIDATHWVLLTHAEQMSDWIGSFASAVEHNQESDDMRASRVSPPTDTPLCQQPVQA